MNNFDIFKQLEDELKDFNESRLKIVVPMEKMDEQNVLAAHTQDYDYNQWEIVQKIRAYNNSQFWHRKKNDKRLFFNNGKFLVSIGRMRTDIDLKNYLFVPDNDRSINGVVYMQRKFRDWAKENNYSQIINDLGDDYPLYGTMVCKTVGKEQRRVPIISLRNTQNVRSLKEAMETGGYVIEEHKYSLAQMKKFKDWDLSAYKKEERYEKECVYERYGLVPEDYYMKITGGSGGDPNVDVLAMAILPEKDDKVEQKPLFMEKVTCPYEEAHWEREDGRWLGIGLMENNFQNQTAVNVIENLRMKNLSWGAKKIFKTSSDDVPKNMQKEAEDGATFYVGPNGTLDQVNTGSQHTADYNAGAQAWDKNRREGAFAFEVASGESLPSGTPFSLGALLSRVVDSYFEKKRENFDLFLQRAFFNQIVPIFKRQNNNEHDVRFGADDEDFDLIKELHIEFYYGKALKDYVFKNGYLPENTDEVRQKVINQVGKKQYLFSKCPEGFYDSIAASMQLVITGEQIDVQSQLETAKTVMQMIQADPTIPTDPVKRRILQKILSKIGVSLDDLIGQTTQAQTLAPGMPQGTPNIMQNAMLAGMGGAMGKQMAGAPMGGMNG